MMAETNSLGCWWVHETVTKEINVLHQKAQLQEETQLLSTKMALRLASRFLDARSPLQLIVASLI